MTEARNEVKFGPVKVESKPIEPWDGMLPVKLDHLATLNIRETRQTKDEAIDVSAFGDGVKSEDNKALLPVTLDNDVTAVLRDRDADYKPGILKDEAMPEPVIESTFHDRNSEEVTQLNADHAALQSNGIIWEGRTLPRIEVVLPSWQDVRKRKSRTEQQAQARTASPAPEQTMNTNESIDHSTTVMMEVDEDNKQLLGLDLDRHDPAGVAQLHAAVGELRNPDFKVKKEMLLSDEFLLDALTWEGINHRFPISLPNEIAEYPFNRRYITDLYGGNIQETFPKPRDDMLEWHRLDDWMFLHLDFNPHAPTKPGRSGLFFSSQKAVQDWPTIQRTFVRQDSAKWVYMGQYKMERGLSLTATAWKEQRQKVRRTWAKGILKKNWGVDACVRIWLRMQKGVDHKISEEDLDTAADDIERIRSVVTEEDIIGAYDRGEEELGTYTMTCVGYDEEFVRVLARNAENYVPPPPTKKSKGINKRGKDGKANRSQTKGNGAGSKRRSTKPVDFKYQV